MELAYGPKQVLNDINLKILPEEWVAVIGANGSGKTSMASLAMGFQAPTKGTVRFRDQAVQAGKISRQAENMLFGATVEKEFLFGFKYRRQRRADKDKEVAVTIDRLIETIDLTKHRNDNPFHLSHGQRKRLACC